MPASDIAIFSLSLALALSIFFSAPFNYLFTWIHEIGHLFAVWFSIKYFKLNYTVSLKRNVTVYPSYSNQCTVNKPSKPQNWLLRSAKIIENKFFFDYAGLTCNDLYDYFSQNKLGDNSIIIQRFIKINSVMGIVFTGIFSALIFFLSFVFISFNLFTCTLAIAIAILIRFISDCKAYSDSKDHAYFKSPKEFVPKHK